MLAEGGGEDGESGERTHSWLQLATNFEQFPEKRQNDRPNSSAFSAYFRLGSVYSHSSFPKPQNFVDLLRRRVRQQLQNTLLCWVVNSRTYSPYMLRSLLCVLVFQPILCLSNRS